MIVSNLQSRPTSTMHEHNCGRPIVRHPTIASQPEMLDDILQTLARQIPPLWPLSEFVAVNPFVSLSNASLLNVHQHLRHHAGAQLLMSMDYFREALASGRFELTDVAEALEECLELDGPQPFAPTPQQIAQRLTDRSASNQATRENEPFRTISELLDREQRTEWSSHFDEEVAKHLATHFDEGQAIWSSPWQHLSFYAAWKKAALLDQRLELLGLRGFRSFVETLPSTATGCIRYVLTLLGIPSALWRPYLTRHLYASFGWACYLKGLDDRDESNQFANENLLGLLAVRLAYEGALVVSVGSTTALEGWTALMERSGSQDHSAPQEDEFIRYVCQTACEIAYRRKLLHDIRGNSKSNHANAGRKDVQMVFCIDVRSEPFRRNLEAVSNRVETLGFAGFFGIPFEYVPLGDKSGLAQCPVLLKPKYRIAEGISQADAGACDHAIARRQAIRGWRAVWKNFKSSATSCFSYVESTGLLFAARLVTDSLGITKPVANGQCDGVPRHLRHALAPVLEKHGTFGLTIDERAEIARAILQNLGLIQDFARVVVLCGHESSTVNNPFRAGLDCGACGGKSGQANAMLAAAILNDKQVRERLGAQAIEIPEDTVFLSAVHDTTTDEIRFTTTPSQPTSQRICRDLRKWLELAGARTRDERARLLGCRKGHELLKRSRDWSEVRPEWGLAGNAAFVVGSRRSTAGLNLGGRTFLHNYEHARDPDGKVLELIMTAPMIVTNWINMQYFAATVDNRFFGSGDKVLHNVVGKLGVVLGNGGDLRPGLPMQSVHDGVSYRHEPLRLLVVIEAPRSAINRVIAKHTMVRDLVLNKWVRLVSAEGNTYFDCQPDGSWKEAA